MANLEKQEVQENKKPLSSEEIGNELNIEQDVKNQINAFFLQKKVSTLELSHSDLEELKSSIQGATKEQQIEKIKSFLTDKLNKEKTDIKTKAQEGINSLKEEVKEKREEAYKKIDGLKIMGLIPIPEFVSKSLKNQVDKKTMTKEELDEKEKGMDFMDKLMSKISLAIGAGLLGYFKDDLPDLDKIGVSSNVENIAETSGRVKTEAVVAGTGIIAGVGELAKKAKEKVEEVVGKEEEEKEEKSKDNKEINSEKMREGFSQIGTYFFKEISGQKFANSIPYTNMVKGLKDKKYSEIRDSLKKYNESKDYNNLLVSLGVNSNTNFTKGREEETQVVLESIVGSNTDYVINGILTKDNIKKIISDEKFEKYFGEDFKKSIEGKNYNDLSLEQISILIPLSYSKLIGTTLENTPNTLKELLFSSENFLKESGENIKNYFEEQSNNVIPKDLFLAFTSSHLLKGEGRINQADTILKGESFTNLPKESKDKLEKIKNFAKEISSKITEDNRFSLDVTGFKDVFNNNLNYRNVIELYILLDGDINKLNKDELNKDTSNMLGVYYWIKTIIGRDNDKQVHGAYISKIISQCNTEESKSSIFNKEQKSLIKQHFLKYGDDFLSGHFEAYENLLGVPQEELKKIIPKGVDVIDATDITILAGVIGGNFLLAKVPLPLPFKITGLFAFNSFGIHHLVFSLWKRGTLEKLLQNGEYTSIITDLNSVLKDKNTSVESIIKNGEIEIEKLK